MLCFVDFMFIRRIFCFFDGFKKRVIQEVIFNGLFIFMPFTTVLAYANVLWWPISELIKLV